MQPFEDIMVCCHRKRVRRLLSRVASFTDIDTPFAEFVTADWICQPLNKPSILYKWGLNSRMNNKLSMTHTFVTNVMPVALLVWSTLFILCHGLRTSRKSLYNIRRNSINNVFFTCFRGKVLARKLVSEAHTKTICYGYNKNVGKGAQRDIIKIADILHSLPDVTAFPFLFRILGLMLEKWILTRERRICSNIPLLRQFIVTK
jgi:hypothetical protein